MSLAVTVDAERDQVVELIVAELASLGEVMHLQGLPIGRTGFQGIPSTGPA